MPAKRNPENRGLSSQLEILRLSDKGRDKVTLLPEGLGKENGRDAAVTARLGYWGENCASR